MHIHEKELNSFTTKALDTQDMIAFLEHLDTCDFCLEQLLQKETQDCIQAPAYLKHQIMAKAASPEMQVSQAAAKASRKMQLFYHTLQTAFGVVAALFLLFCSSNIEFPVRHPKPPVQREYVQDKELPEHGNQFYQFTQSIENGISKGTDTFAKYLNEFSNKLLNGGK